MEDNNQKIIFALPTDVTILEVINEILKDVGLEESDQEFFDKDMKNQEPRAVIVRDAAIAVAQKKVPEDKLIELLKQHLETSQEISKKILDEIKQQLIPFAVVQEIKTDYQEELLEKLRATRKVEIPDMVDMSTPQVPGPKPPVFTNVEKNAKSREKEDKKAVEPNKSIPKPQNQPSDKYKEPVE